VAAESIIRQLAALPLFQGMPRAQLTELARRGEQVIYYPGTTIIEENAEAHAAILILSGLAVRVSGPELKSRIASIEAGSLLAEAAMLVETVHASTVVARGNVRGLQSPRQELQALITEDRTVGDIIVQNLAERLLRLSDELREVDALLAPLDSPVPSVPGRAEYLAALPPSAP
jgi:CRP-like cAMP-binding protein